MAESVAAATRDEAVKKYCHGSSARWQRMQRERGYHSARSAWRLRRPTFEPRRRARATRSVCERTKHGAAAAVSSSAAPAGDTTGSRKGASPLATPAPGAHQPPFGFSTLRRVGGALPPSSAPSELDQVIRRARQLPGPGAYEAPMPTTSGGRFQKAPNRGREPRSRSPGPGAYDAPRPRTAGGRIGASSAPSFAEREMARAAELPGPADYEADRATRMCAGMHGGRFNAAKVKSEAEWAIYTARDMPGPGQYEATAPRIRGGRFNASVLPTYAELQMARAAALPGPADYCPTDYSGIAVAASHNAGHAQQQVRVRRLQRSRKLPLGSRNARPSNRPTSW